MKYLAITAFYILISINLILGESIDKSDEYPNKLVLKEPDLYYVYWKANSENITFEIHVKNSKWLLFGVSNEDYSDVVVAWLNDDLYGHFSDRKIVDKNDDFDLTIDEDLDWIPLDLYKEDNYTIAKFYRPIKVECRRDTNDDLDINPGKISVVFSDGDEVKYDDDSIKLQTLSEVKVDLLGETEGPFECKTEISETKISFDSTPTSNYVNVVDFIEGVYRMYWNFSETDIVAEIHVKTTGWVGFGFSPNGGMNGSDVVVGWIKNGVANFTDRFITDRTVKIDKNQNWKLLKYAETNGFTIFKFQRDIKLCDSEDLTIDRGSPNMIFAYGETDPADGGDISYHLFNRGTKKFNIINRNKVEDITDPDTEIYDFEIKHVILPRVDTLYLCKMFQVPLNITEKRHIYKTELILPKRNFGKFHHVDADECTTNFEKSLPAFDCFKNTEDVKDCTVQGYAWSVGGDLVHLYPRDAGYPIGGDSGYQSFHLVVHYNNPGLEIGYIEKFKFRHYVTKNLREKELGFMTIGTASNGFGIAIPPRVDNFKIYGYCDNECLGQKLKDGDITVISANPHTHLTGIEVSTKIMRNGVDIGYLHRNQNYDFNYQDMYMLNPPVNITKNDELITTCTYRTLTKSSFTLGGRTTHDEMCMTFFLYYPRIKGFNVCGSAPTIKGYSEFLNKLNKDGDINIKPISNYTLDVLVDTLNETFEQLKNKTITNNLRDKFVKFFDETNFITSCDLKITGNDTIQLKTSLIEKNECQSNFRFY